MHASSSRKVYLSHQLTLMHQFYCMFVVVVVIIHGAESFPSAQPNPKPMHASRRVYLSRQLKLMHPSTRKMAISTSLKSHRSLRSNDDDVCIRILCLHGKGGDGEQFVKSSLMPLRSLVERRNSLAGIENNNLSFQWEALTAPYEIDNTGGYSWWTMSPGVRSYNAKEVRGCFRLHMNA